MAEREVTITIRGKNLTQTEFSAARKEVLGLGEDADKTSAKSVTLGQAFKGSFAVVAAAGTAVVATIGAIGFAVNELGQRGSTVVGVRDAFNALARSIGESGDAMLKATSGATKGLISDLDVMAAVNKGVLLGLPITAKEMTTLSTTAIVLGKAMKVGPTDALNDLITGLGRGSPAILDNLGITLSSAAAYETYGRSIGKAASDLTDKEKKLAVYQSAMIAAKAKVDEMGGIQLTFADRVTQGKVALSNFIDKQGESIARSPVLAAGMDSIGKSLAEAFGSKQETLIDLVTSGVNRLAIMAIDTGIYLVELGRSGAQAFGVIRVPIAVVVEAIADLVRVAAESLATMSELAAKVPGTGKAFDYAASAARLMADGLGATHRQAEKSLADARELASGNSEVDRSLQRVSKALQDAKTDMVAASLSTRENTAAADANAEATRLAAAAARDRAAAAEAQAEADKKVQAAAEKLTASIKRLDTADFFVPLKKGVFELSQELEELPSSTLIAERGLTRFKATVHDTGTEVEGLGASIRTGLSEVLVTIPGTLARAFEGGGDLMGAVKSIGSQVGSALGRSVGESFKALGSLGGPLGAALGSLVGPLIGKIGSLFSSKNTAEVKAYNTEIAKVQGTLLEQFGTLEDLEIAAQSVGLSFKANWGHQGQAGLQAFNTLAQEFRQRWDGIHDGMAAANGELATLIKQGADLGYEFDQSGNLVRVSVDKMREVAGKFGLDLGALGPAFDQAGLRTRMGDVINGFELMDKGGTQTGTILAGMKDEINQIVNDSIKFGVDIPENMKPWIANLIETGQLTDENGEKITDLTALKFGAPIATEFEKVQDALLTVVSKLDELITRLAGVTAAVNGIPDRTIHVGWNIDDPPEIADFSGSKSGNTHGFARGTFGAMGVDFPDFGSGTRAVLHHREAVVPYEDRIETAKRWLGGAAMAASIGTAAVVAPNVYIVNDFTGARQVTEAEFKQIQARVNAGGITVPIRNLTQRTP